MYEIGLCFLVQGKFEDAIKNIRDSMAVTGVHGKIIPVEHARNLFKM